MTTEAPSNIKAIEAQIMELEKALAEAAAEAAKRTAEVQAMPDTDPMKFVLMGEIGNPVRLASNKLAAARESLAAAKAVDAWESSIEIRQPVLDVISAQIVSNPPAAKLESVTGAIRIDAEGNVTVDLRPVIGKIDLEAIEVAIAESVDPAAFAEHGFTNVTINVDLTKSPATTSLTIGEARKAAASKSATTDGQTTRAGALEYEYNGQWLGSRAFLEAVRTSGHEIVTKREKAFINVLDNNGNGMSNLAKSVAETLSVASREKPADE